MDGIMKAKDWFSDLARGATLGLGILPGVSVGTIGIIVHVYDKLIDSIDGLRHKFGKSFCTLLPLALGCIISAVVLLIFWQKVARVYFPFIMISVLAGIVIGSLPVILIELKGEKITPIAITRVGIGFLVAAAIGAMSFLSAKFSWSVFSFQDAFMNPFSSWWIFFVVFIIGFVAAVACLIPGISGSMVLFIFGLYNPVVGIFISERDADGNILYPSIFEDHSRIGSGIVLTLVLLVGILLGFFAISKAMKSLLANHKIPTFEVVLGFVTGSVVSMFVNNDMYSVYVTPATSAWWQFLIGAILLLLSASLMWFLIKREQKRTLSAE